MTDLALMKGVYLSVFKRCIKMSALQNLTIMHSLDYFTLFQIKQFGVLLRQV